MRIIFFCLLLPIFCAAKSASSDSTAEKYLDLDDNEDSVIVWESLFTKINTILSETTKQRESQNKLLESQIELTESLVKLNKRQDTQELKLTSFMENTEKQFTDLKKGRQDGSVNFYRNWTEYQKGFGNSDGEFFIGLERLHYMTSVGAPQELMVVLKSFRDSEYIAKYDLFQIGNETEKYALKQLGKYSGYAGDALSPHKGMMFSTYDQDNDQGMGYNCAKTFGGAWWFNMCYGSHLFGPYRSEENAAKRGVGWFFWQRKSYSLKFAEMKIRSISF